MSYVRTAVAVLASATLLAAAPGLARALNAPGDFVRPAPQAQGWTASANRVDRLGPKYNVPAVAAPLSAPAQPTGGLDWTPIAVGIGIAALALGGAGLVVARRHRRLPEPKAGRLAPM